MKWEVENLNGERGKVLKRHEKLEEEMVNEMQGIILRQLTVGVACISCSGFESGSSVILLPPLLTVWHPDQGINVLLNFNIFEVECTGI